MGMRVVWRRGSGKHERDSAHLLLFMYAANNPMIATTAANPGDCVGVDVGGAES